MFARSQEEVKNVKPSSCTYPSECCVLKARDRQLHWQRMMLRVAVKRLGGKFEVTTEDMVAAQDFLVTRTTRETLDTTVYGLEIEEIQRVQGRPASKSGQRAVIMPAMRFASECDSD